MVIQPTQRNPRLPAPRQDGRPLGVREFFRKVEWMLEKFQGATGLPVRLVRTDCDFELPAPHLKVCHRSREQSNIVVNCLRFHRNIHEAGRTSAEKIQGICPNGMLNGALPIGTPGSESGYLAFGPIPSSKARSGHPALDLVEFLAGQIRGEWAQVAEDDAAAIPAPIFKAMRHIRDNLPRPLTLAGVAAVAALSPDRFGRVFRRYTGRTFSSYVVLSRVECACRMLSRSPHMRISEIAMECGFDSIPYFNRVFARITGCSPSRFREKNPSRQG